MAYGIGRDNKLGKKSESKLTTTQILIQHLQPINMVTTG